ATMRGAGPVLAALQQCLTHLLRRLVDAEQRSASLAVAAGQLLWQHQLLSEKDLRHLSRFLNSRVLQTLQLQRKHGRQSRTVLEPVPILPAPLVKCTAADLGLAQKSVSALCHSSLQATQGTGVRHDNQ
ncbi:unnamed protein product, partial [Effrenium voratum]